MLPHVDCPCKHAAGLLSQLQACVCTLCVRDSGLPACDRTLLACSIMVSACGVNCLSGCHLLWVCDRRLRTPNAVGWRVAAGSLCVLATN